MPALFAFSCALHIRSSLYPVTILFILSLIGLSTRSFAQEPEERVYLKYHGRIANAPDDLVQTTCLFRFSPPGQAENDLYQEEQELALHQGRFSTTLGAQEDPLFAAIFKEALELHVSCDSNGDGVFDLSVSESVGQSPISARAFSAAKVDRVEAHTIYAGNSQLFGSNGSWQGPPMIPEYQGVPLISNDGRWIGDVSASEANIDQLTSEQIQTYGLVTTELYSISSQSNRHYLKELYLSPADESSEPTLLINEQGIWQGEFNVSYGIATFLDVSGLYVSSLNRRDGTEIINNQGQWVGPLPEGDRDADGFSDLQEIAFGSDPYLANDYPLDADQNGIPDLLEPKTTLADTLVSNQFNASERTVETLPISQDTPWTAAKVTFNPPHSAQILTLEVILSLSYTDAEGGALPFNSLKISLVKDELNLLLHDQTDLFIGQYPELDRPVNQWQVQGVLLNGEWQLIIEDLSASPGTLIVHELILNASYQVEGELVVNQSLNFGASQRINNLPVPVSPSEAVNKSYVDDHLSYPGRFTYRSKTFTPYLSSLNDDTTSRALFGGVSMNDWLNNGITQPAVLSSALDLQQLDSFLTEQGQAGSNVLFVQTIDSYPIKSIFVAQFEIENTTSSPITWTPHLNVSCQPNLPSSLALDGVNLWQSKNDVTSDAHCLNGKSTAQVTANLPPSQVSSFTMIVRSNTSNELFAAFINDSAELPTGLRYRAHWR